MHCISISHKTTPVNIRELFAFSSDEQLEFEKQLLQEEKLRGCVIVSTCNRSEIYFSGDKTSIDIVEKQLAKFKNAKQSEIRKYFNVYSNDEAVRHLFRVACGLDSMVLGEDEILRQVKDAYELSLNNKFSNVELNLAFQGALSSAKAIKTDTKLSNTPVSIGTLTANKIIEYLKTKENSRVLIVGISGKMGSIVAKNLCSKDISIIGTSRSHNKSNGLFSNISNIQISDYKDRYKFLKRADVIVSATTSPHYTFTYDEVLNVLDGCTSNKLFIDLAVPGDIDKDILNIKGMDIVDIDYFEKASKENNRIKLKELDKAQIILDKCIDEALKNMRFQEFHTSIDKINKKVQEKGFPYVLYHLKRSLNSEQLGILLDSLDDIISEEK
ncbi:glutamyl-tRNA reductase [Clostridium homopropionicum DSM 5847]|uniref:Glutamyl-tRNA reductase n=1 Tax=Clostridium homopropionicum DSM 5847 TaxID=1121318 RepID=A0A0L6ZD44_9CLOT|nr:glutamyl-tRNA reductase [Clostridium homopropionicum]KOA20698.1 glutamyl-tRNA reductase [Clostridium homopropionicum DSM 5847]SFF91217.1 glutamyl-tRNA reductase [Clostridium homopropionicum]